MEEVTSVKSNVLSKEGRKKMEEVRGIEGKRVGRDKAGRKEDSGTEGGKGGRKDERKNNYIDTREREKWS